MRDSLAVRPKHTMLQLDPGKLAGGPGEGHLELWDLFAPSVPDYLAISISGTSLIDNFVFVSHHIIQDKW